MAYPYDKDTIDALFSSRGAQIYWENWNKLKSWYEDYMLPEMLKSQINIRSECQRCTERTRKRKRSRKKHRKNADEACRLQSPAVCDNGSDNMENAVENMSPEFLEFYKKTLQHRSDLKKFREQQIAEDVVEYIADDDGPEEKPKPSTAPPDVQAGTARTKGLESLYGSASFKIQMLETRLQAKFDENRTRLQPKLWPVIPLNL